jgi:hypothetical protein
MSADGKKPVPNVTHRDGPYERSPAIGQLAQRIAAAESRLDGIERGLRSAYAAAGLPSQERTRAVRHLRLAASNGQLLSADE